MTEEASRNRVAPKTLSEMTDEEIRERFPRGKAQLQEIGAVVTADGLVVALGPASAQEFRDAITKPDAADL